MPYDGQGVFTRVMNWEEDAANDISVLASRHDAEDDNFANGFNEVLCRDGRAAMTGNLKMGTNKITQVANGTADNDAVNLSQLNSTSSTLSTAINTAVTNVFSSLYPVGSVYMGNTPTCPIAALIPSSTWVLKASHLVTSVDSTVAVKGDGKALGITQGNNGTKTWCARTDGGGVYSSIYQGAYTSATLPTNVGSYDATANNVAVGVTTNASQSGLTGTATSSSITINIWERTA